VKISKIFLAAMFSAAIGLSTPSYGQSSSEIESAVRAGRRAADEYRRQEQDSKDSANQALYEKNMAEIRVLEKICRPMWRQSQLTRREFIETFTKKKSERRAISKVCFENEIWMNKWCSPPPSNQGWSDADKCVGKAEDWPEMPEMKEFLEPTFRLSEFDPAMQRFYAAVAKKYE